MSESGAVSQSIAEPLTKFALQVYLSNIPDDETLVRLDTKDPANPMLTAEWGSIRDDR